MGLFSPLGPEAGAHRRPDVPRITEAIGSPYALLALIPSTPVQPGAPMTAPRGRGGRGGRPKLPPELIRSEAIKIQVTPGMLADMQEISGAWGVGVSSVGFAFVASALADARRMHLDLGCMGVEFAAALLLHAKQAERSPTR